MSQNRDILRRRAHVLCSFSSFVSVFPKLTFLFCLTRDPNFDYPGCKMLLAICFQIPSQSNQLRFSLFPVLTPFTFQYSHYQCHKFSGAHISSQVLCYPPPQPPAWLFPLSSLSFLVQVVSIHLGISKSLPPHKNFSKFPSSDCFLTSLQTLQNTTPLFCYDNHINYMYLPHHL